jgi:cytochrome c oxidase subunit II
VSLLASAPLLATNWGSPSGITTTSPSVINLWRITYYIAIPIGLIVIGLIVWCLVRYRHKPGDRRVAKQFQYHIPIEAAYTIIPLILVVVVFGFMYGVDNKIDNVTKTPALKINVQGFQWGWRFTYPNGHEEIGSIQSQPTINDSEALPVLYMPEHEVVQFTLQSDDVNHSFYVPEFLFKRDLIQGINNVVDINVTRTGTFIGECTQLCGTYHAFMRFEVDVMTPTGFNTWMKQQPMDSITCAGGSGTGASCS